MPNQVLADTFLCYQLLDTEACPCNTDYCGDNAVCRVLKPLTCKCKAGFTGNGSNCNGKVLLKKLTCGILLGRELLS